VRSFRRSQELAAEAYFWRIKRNGRTITIERSDDGINFVLVSAHTLGSQIDGINIWELVAKRKPTGTCTPITIRLSKTSTNQQ